MFHAEDAEAPTKVSPSQGPAWGGGQRVGARGALCVHARACWALPWTLSAAP